MDDKVTDADLYEEKKKFFFSFIRNGFFLYSFLSHLLVVFAEAKHSSLSLDFMFYDCLLLCLLHNAVVWSIGQQ